MELQRAIAQIDEIQRHLASTETFRGYRSMTVAASGLIGLIAAGIQTVWLPQPGEQVRAYLFLWGTAAAINLTMVGLQVWSHAARGNTSVSRRTTLFAIEQFLPALVAGGLLTLVIVQRVGEVVWMLPGLWAILFSLGIFASCRLLPRAVFVVGAWYLFCGMLALVLGQNEHALAPWLMGVPFGIGQLLAAGVLYITLEKPQA